ncbi:MAG TPA: PDZ domain-containing protein [Candidatus Sulfotelmatobacter sp.]|nr:PDZ domain-containing protein [Candidatus Sulfotelmatobacter sp.]
MKQTCKVTTRWSRTMAGFLAVSVLSMTGVAAAMAQSATVVSATNFNSGGAGGSGGSNRNEVVIEAIKPPHAEGVSERKEMPWLGLSAEEASEALASQLNLQPGVGLVVTYLAPDSPAAKAGLQKNDVLVQFDGQALVVPAQLRKLVQVHKEGDRVELAFYRAGKQQTATVTLGKTATETGWFGDEHLFQGNLRELQKQLQDLPIRDAIREQMKVLRDSMGNIRIDQRKVQEEVRRSMEKAQKAFHEAMRNMTNVDATMGPVREALEDLAKSGVTVDNHATVTVRSAGNTSKSLVNSDPSGTIVLVRNPRLHLTAHDKDGHLLFDGEIDTPEQQAKVPRDLWQKVEPLLDKMEAGPEKPLEKPEAEE